MKLTQKLPFIRTITIRHTFFQKRAPDISSAKRLVENEFKLQIIQNTKKVHVQSQENTKHKFTKLVKIKAMHFQQTYCTEYTKDAKRLILSHPNNFEYLPVQNVNIHSQASRHVPNSSQGRIVTFNVNDKIETNKAKQDERKTLKA